MASPLVIHWYLLKGENETDKSVNLTLMTMSVSPDKGFQQSNRL